MTDPATPSMFVRTRAVERIVGLKEPAINRAIRAGEFPRPFLIGIRAKAWKQSEIDDWLKARDEARANYIDPAVPSPRIAA